MSLENELKTPTTAAEASMEEKGDSSSEADVEYDEKATKALLRKVDIHIVPVLVILYLLSFLDRTNIGNARLAHLEKDLGMTGLDYNVCRTHPMHYQPQTLTTAWADRTRHPLPVLCGRGDPFQHHDEAHETFDMAAIDYGSLGGRVYADGSLHELRGAAVRSRRAWTG